jgi:hypothetical protein
LLSPRGSASVGSLTRRQQQLAKRTKKLPKQRQMPAGGNQVASDAELLRGAVTSIHGLALMKQWLGAVVENTADVVTAGMEKEKETANLPYLPSSMVVPTKPPRRPAGCLHCLRMKARQATSQRRGKRNAVKGCHHHGNQRRCHNLAAATGEAVRMVESASNLR